MSVKGGQSFRGTEKALVVHDDLLLASTTNSHGANLTPQGEGTQLMTGGVSGTIAQTVSSSANPDARETLGNFRMEEMKKGEFMKDESQATLAGVDGSRVGTVNGMQVEKA